MKAPERWPAGWRTVRVRTQTADSFQVQTTIHCLPLNDLREHSLASDCWCRPINPTDEPRVWIHTSMDRREEYEQGRKLS